MKEIEVLYQLGKNAKEPTQGYTGDFAYDLYAAKGALIPPLTFKSVKIETNLKVAFDENKVGMKLNLRSGAASKLPLVLSNSTGIVEGTYRNTLKLLVRNTFIDNRLVDFVFDSDGDRIKVSEVPDSVLKEARKFYDEETRNLGYDKPNESIVRDIYKTLVPAGTVFIASGDRIAQAHFQEKINAKWNEVSSGESLPKSVRGEGGLGSSGSK